MKNDSPFSLFSRKRGYFKNDSQERTDFKMKNARDAFGYIIGLVLFIILIPIIMWKASGDFSFGTGHVVALLILGIAGIALSIWSIVHMRRVGKGNPMDAFNHEVAPRTSQLMTDGPYAICRNPMLLGVLLYYLGFVILLASVKAALVLVAYAAIMSVQVRAEERRLEADFGEAYLAYKSRTKRLIPFVW